MQGVTPYLLEPAIQFYFYLFSFNLAIEDTEETYMRKSVRKLILAQLPVNLHNDAAVLRVLK